MCSSYWATKPTSYGKPLRPKVSRKVWFAWVPTSCLQYTSAFSAQPSTHFLSREHDNTRNIKVRTNKQTNVLVKHKTALPQFLILCNVILKISQPRVLLLTIWQEILSSSHTRALHDIIRVQCLHWGKESALKSDLSHSRYFLWVFWMENVTIHFHWNMPPSVET